jgi:hypothetical protein
MMLPLKSSKKLMSTAKVSKTERFLYFIAHPETSVSPTSAIWQAPLPISRHCFGRSNPDTVSYEEYFRAIRAFFEKDGYNGIAAVLCRHLQQRVDPAGIRHIRIYQEKHGEFYHPARIQIHVNRKKISFVLNVALSDTGKRFIAREYADLQRLTKEFSRTFVPRVDLFGSVASGDCPEMDMFLGEWFEKYNEFHISRDPSDNQFKIRVWDDTNGRYYLKPALTGELYRQAARIMAYYYNVETSEHIASWHHGAGDFVVRVDNSGLDVRLIAVRRYTPLIRDLNGQPDPAKKAEHLLQALLIFFLNLSLRMRLDRENGVGDLVWSNGSAVQGTLKGFLEGLALKCAVSSLPDCIEMCFKSFLSVCSPADLYELSEAVVNAVNPEAPEVPLIKHHLKAHVADVFDAIRQL